MSNTKVRIAGSGLTILNWNGKTLALLQTLQDTAPTPVAQAQAIQSITDVTPTEIATARAVGAGTLRLTFYEVWNQPAWYQLTTSSNSSVARAQNLLEILQDQVAQTADFSVSKIIRPLGNSGANSNAAVRGDNGGAYVAKVYNGVRIVDADEGEQVQIGTMTIPRVITCMYTHATTKFK